RGGSPLHAHIVAADVMLEAAELEGLMKEATAALDEENRRLVILRDVEELSYQEIGEITGLAEGTIKSRLHRARMAIKEHLDKHTREPRRQVPIERWITPKPRTSSPTSWTARCRTSSASRSSSTWRSASSAGPS